jgi:anthraniloyl-CoA monooxygenase
VELRFGTRCPTTRRSDALGLGDADLVVAADGVNSRIRASTPTQLPPGPGRAPGPFSGWGPRALRRLHLHLRRERARRLPGARLPLRRDRSPSSWSATRRRGAPPASTGWARPRRWPPASASSRPGWTGTRCAATRRTARRPGSASPASPTSAGTHGGRRGVVLIGDAAHTAHFSIGSGPSWRWRTPSPWRALLGGGGRWRRRSPPTRRSACTEALRLQNAARNSMEWFENVRRYVTWTRSSSPTRCSRAASA